MWLRCEVCGTSKNLTYRGRGYTAICLPCIRKTFPKYRGTALADLDLIISDDDDDEQTDTLSSNG